MRQFEPSPEPSPADPAVSGQPARTEGLPVLRIERFASFEQRQAEFGPHLNRRWQLDEGIADLLQEDWPGYCPLCERPVEFRIGASPGQRVNVREALHCSGCGINARSRAGLLIALQEGMTRRSRIYVTEQASTTYAWLQSRYPAAIGSEFAEDDESRRLLGAYLRSLGGHGEVRFEDVTKLSFRDGELDWIISYEVLEHVPDYRAALSEFARILAPGGRLILTAPFLANSRDTIVRARMRGDGSVEHLLESEYHGDPLGDGILCWYHFGWDLLDEARRLGFRDAQMALPWAPSFGVFSGLWTMVAQR